MKRILITAVISLVAGVVLGVLAARRMPPSHEQVASYLTSLSMGDFRDFAKAMNARLGFQAFTQQLFPSMPPEPQK